MPVTESVRLSKLRLGDILLARRLITPEQLQEALAEVKARGGRLGEVLVSKGYLAESDLVGSLAQQLGMPYAAGEPEVDLRVARLISEETAQRLQALPIQQEGNVLVVALADPVNFMALDHIALKTGQSVRPLAVTSTALQRIMVRVFGIPEGEEEDGTATPVYDIGLSEENPVIRLVNTLCTQAIAHKASDIHIEPMEDRVRVRYRVDGSLIEGTPLPRSIHAALTSRIKVMAGMDIAERRVPQDGQIMVIYNDRRFDLRVSTLPTSQGERMAIRLLERNQGLRSLNELGMPAREEKLYREMIGRPNGLILVTGPTGSGKSTTLMATLAALNRTDVNILAIEDPVEYHLPGISQVQINPKAGLTFASGLRSFLRQDPDIIMIGEIRDVETADIAIRAALTGHLVFSTLHTNEAAGAVGRLVDMGVEPFLLASALLGVVAQRLVRVLCPRCKEPYAVPPDSPVRYLPGMPEGPLTLYRPKGCGFCGHLGYQGRQAIFEVLPITPRLREMVVARASPTAIQDEALHSGLMRGLWSTGLEKALSGLTSIEEVQKVAFAEA